MKPPWGTVQRHSAVELLWVWWVTVDSTVLVTLLHRDKWLTVTRMSVTILFAFGPPFIYLLLDCTDE